jgi:hypothetical protein
VEYNDTDFAQKGLSLEHKARNMLVTKLKSMGAAPEDLVYIGDVDQVLRPEVLWLFKWAQTNLTQTPASTGQTQFVHSFSWMFTGKFQ